MTLDLPDRLTDRQRALLTDLSDRCQDRYTDRLLGLVLSGSAGRNFATPRSDLDVYVVLSESLPSDPEAHKTPELDELPIAFADLSEVSPFGTEGWWLRWSFAWAPILLDRSGGRLALALAAQATVSDQEALEILTTHDRLDGWLNFAYRALKSERDERPLELRLDAAESIPWLLDVVFTLAGRVRPYNKYLAWELRHHPLPDWSADRLLELVEATLAGNCSAIRATFAHVEPLCRAWEANHDVSALTDLIAGWGTELDLLRA